MTLSAVCVMIAGDLDKGPAYGCIAPELSCSDNNDVDRGAGYPRGDQPLQGFGGVMLTVVELAFGAFFARVLGLLSGAWAYRSVSHAIALDGKVKFCGCIPWPAKLDSRIIKMISMCWVIGASLGFYKGFFDTTNLKNRAQEGLFGSWVVSLSDAFNDVCMYSFS